ncbi:hypothetical protein [Desulfosediminicola flagellatus]|uniref:hypothetical protein n=1 Tax=Desulfosediminicola flagellatus TaxID=2569541 RepID=UPI0010ACD7C0|nr:hypothetical protein [Desulfosediminicola flagellatus]
MSQQLSPKTYGLTARTVLEQLDETTIAIVINRKSRIIMADGKKILEKVRVVKKHQPKATIVLKTNAPLCSKTRLYLEAEGIPVIALLSSAY